MAKKSIDKNKDKPQKKKPEYVSKNTLKYRGWTEAGINRFLKMYDKEAINPHYKSAPPMRLYLLSRVEKIEKSKKFLDFQEKNTTKIAGAKKAAETRKQRLLKEVQGWEIELKREDYEMVVYSAIEAYNEFKGNLALERKNIEYETATIDSDPTFLKRITKNYLRHELSNYEDKLEEIFGKTGTYEAYIIIKKKIEKKIAEIYPELSRMDEDEETK
ncbi:MAG: hypothetical protein WA144_01655 [Candidatus Methanoperedens sp.]